MQCWLDALAQSQDDKIPNKCETAPRHVRIGTWNEQKHWQLCSLFPGSDAEVPTSSSAPVRKHWQQLGAFSHQFCSRTAVPIREQGHDMT